MDTTMKKLPAKPVDRKKQVVHWLIAIVTIILIVWWDQGNCWPDCRSDFLRDFPSGLEIRLQWLW